MLPEYSIYGCSELNFIYMMQSSKISHTMKKFLICGLFLTTWAKPHFKDSISPEHPEQGEFLDYHDVDLALQRDLEDLSKKHEADVKKLKGEIEELKSNMLRKFKTIDEDNWTGCHRNSGVQKFTCAHDGLVLDVIRGNAADGASLNTYGYHGENNQKWNVELLHGLQNVFTITSMMKKNLAIDADLEDQNKVQMWDYNGGSNQKWKFINVPDALEYFYIQNVQTGKHLQCDNPRVTLQITNSTNRRQFWSSNCV